MASALVAALPFWGDMKTAELNARFVRGATSRRCTAKYSFRTKRWRGLAAELSQQELRVLPCDADAMMFFGSPPPPPFSYAQCYADFLTNALGEPSVLRAFLLTVGVATFVALPLIAILNADKVVKPDKPIIHKHPLFNPNVQRDLNFPTYAQCSAFFFAVYLIAVGTAINVAPVRTHAFFQSTIICGELPPVDGGWLAGFGTFGVFYVGLFYIVSAWHNLRQIFWMTVYARLLFLPVIHVGAVLAGRMPVACLEAFIPTDVITALHMLWSLRKDKTTYEYPSWKTNH